MRTTHVQARTLISGASLVGKEGGVSRVLGDAAPDPAYQATVVVPTEHGVVHLGADEYVPVVDTSRRASRGSLVRAAQGLMDGGWDDPNFPDGHNSEYLRGMIEVIVDATLGQDEDSDTVREEIGLAIHEPR